MVDGVECEKNLFGKSGQIGQGIKKPSAGLGCGRFDCGQSLGRTGQAGQASEHCGDLFEGHQRLREQAEVEIVVIHAGDARQILVGDQALH